MARKRRSGILESEAMLGRVIRVLETDDSPLEDPDPQRVLQLLRVYHAALVDLLTHGPLLCDEAVAREQEKTEHFPLQRADVSVLRAELLQLFRSAVRQAEIGAPSTAISTKTVSYTVRLVDGRASIAASGDTRSLVILQAMLLLNDVGLTNVHECTAPDCRRLFVKVYRREFCSEQCQKRINTRKQRQIAREQRERLARRRRQRRKKGSVANG
jgi:CGNR zinc finger